MQSQKKWQKEIDKIEKMMKPTPANARIIENLKKICDNQEIAEEDKKMILELDYRQILEFEE